VKYVLAFAISALAVWATLTAFSAEHSVAQERFAHPAPGTGGRGEPRVTSPRISRGQFPSGRDPGSPVDTFERLKHADRWTADNLRQALELGLERLVRDAHANHANDPAECARGLEVLPTVALVEAEAERVTISIGVRADARLAEHARRCLRDYFAGRVDVRDDEVGGPFPVTTLEVDYPMPARLSEYLGEDPVRSPGRP
jgi:hypothetical protein